MVTDVPCVKMLTWNRPKQLNALTLGMIRRAQPLIESWDEPDNVVARCILFEGAGGKAFCAGGDIKSLYAPLWLIAGRWTVPPPRHAG